MTLEARHAILDALEAALDPEHAAAVIDHRKSKKCALTAFAAKLLAKEFAKCPDPNAAAEEMIIRGWTGFKADWMRRAAKTTGRRNYVDVAMDRFNGSAVVQGNDPDVGGVSPEERRPRFDGECLRIGSSGPFVTSRH